MSLDGAQNMSAPFIRPRPTNEDVERANRLNFHNMGPELLMNAYRELAADYYALERYARNV